MRKIIGYGLIIISITGLVITIIVILLFHIFLNYLEPITLKDVNKIDSVKIDIFKEFIKFFIQFIFLALGAGILIGEYNRIRQKKADLRSFRKEIYKSLVDVYLKTKRIRWSLRANCKNSEIDYQLYKNEMDKMIDIKANLEIIIHEIKAYTKAFKNIDAELISKLEEMENYLRYLLNEFHESPRITDSSNKINITGLPYNEKFIRTIPKNQNFKNNPSDFTEKYRSHFYKALELLKENELKMISVQTQKFIGW